MKNFGIGRGQRYTNGGRLAPMHEGACQQVEASSLQIHQIASRDPLRHRIWTRRNDQQSASSAEAASIKSRDFSDPQEHQIETPFGSPPIRSSAAKLMDGRFIFCHDTRGSPAVAARIKSSC